MHYLLEVIPFWVFILLSASSVISGDYFAKLWSVQPRPSLFILAVVAYSLSGIFYTPALLKEGLVLTSLVWSLLTIVGFLFIGLVLFNETLSPVQWTGAALGIIALLILSIA